MTRLLSRMWHQTSKTMVICSREENELIANDILLCFQTTAYTKAYKKFERRKSISLLTFSWRHIWDQISESSLQQPGTYNEKISLNKSSTARHSRYALLLCLRAQYRLLLANLVQTVLRVFFLLYLLPLCANGHSESWHPQWRKVKVTVIVSKVTYASVEDSPSLQQMTSRPKPSNCREMPLNVSIPLC